MKYYIVTYGCQMNKSDSERIAAVLEEIGFKKAENKKSADIVIINTCSVRQTAEDRVFGLIEAIRRHNNATKTPKKNGVQWRSDGVKLASKPIIAVTGCMVGRDKDGSLRKKLKGVDIFFTIDELPLLAQKLDVQKMENSNRKWKIENGKSQFPVSNFHNQFPISKQQISKHESYLSIPPKSNSPTSRYLTIQTGCDEYCSYCVVPYARGREHNRPLKDILEEAKKIIKEGATEIMLLGQIVNKWTASDPEHFSSNNPFIPKGKVIGLQDQQPVWSLGNGQGVKTKKPMTKTANYTGRQDQQPRLNSNFDFAALLWELNNLNLTTYNLNLGFMSPHPRYISDEIIKALALPKMANYLHLPVQSGDDEILRKMNRKYTAGDYLKIIKKIRKVKPNIELGTDIIVGFPGETEKQFQNTVKLCKKVKFNIAYIAMYSPRSGTTAFKNFLDNVPHKIKKQRWLTLNNLVKITK